jgi:NADPH-dependent 2,4-dienoyl-CoA reductase/sulfur reductase-like enzyme/nitrite reductase/ring-hydroxylating ferredoxin subunit
MTQEQPSANGPDLSLGVTAANFKDGKLLGHVGDKEVLLVRSGGEVFAVDAHCTHYGGPLVEGLVTGDGIRCPWHHACFDLRIGEAVRAPATFSLNCWQVEEKDGRIFVRGKRQPAKTKHATQPSAPGRIVIIGGGAAGFAAAEMLRRREFGGHIAMISGDPDAPVDRPNLSKEYLAGSAPEEWLPLRPDGFYKENNIDLRLGTDVVSIDTKNRHVVIAGGEQFGFDRLLLATGAEPVRLAVPGAGQPNVHTLRSLADSRAIIAAAKGAKRAVVVGASFIGLETAASLRARTIDVHVVALDKCPMKRILGPELGDFIRTLHEERGAIFHLEDTVAAISGTKVTLKSGGVLDADLVVAGIGVQPRLSLAENAGLALDRGVTVNEYLETNITGIYAAGDIARWPDRHSGDNIRVEHWVVAERQGQVAALNMLGGRHKFEAVPFFWSAHYDVVVNYVGHAEQWDEILIDGDIKAKDCLVNYRKKGRTLAVASIFRDLASLQAEADMERAA